MTKTVQLFHDMLRKGVSQLLGDPNCEASQWPMGCYCGQTTYKASCAEVEDSKWEQMIYL